MLSNDNSPIIIHPALLLVSLLNPRSKSLPTVDVRSEAGVEEKLLELINKSETEHCYNHGFATADIEMAPAERKNRQRNR